MTDVKDSTESEGHNADQLQHGADRNHGVQRQRSESRTEEG